MKNTNIKKSRSHTTSSGVRSKASKASAAEQAAREAANVVRRNEQIAAAASALEAGKATLGQLRFLAAHSPAVLEDHPGLRQRLEGEARRKALASTYRAKATRVRTLPVYDFISAKKSPSPVTTMWDRYLTR